MCVCVCGREWQLLFLLLIQPVTAAALNIRWWQWARQWSGTVDPKLTLRIVSFWVKNLILHLDESLVTDKWCKCLRALSKSVLERNCQLKIYVLLWCFWQCLFVLLFSSAMHWLPSLSAYSLVCYFPALPFLPCAWKVCAFYVSSSIALTTRTIIWKIWKKNNDRNITQMFVCQGANGMCFLFLVVLVVAVVLTCILVMMARGLNLSWIQAV